MQRRKPLPLSPAPRHPGHRHKSYLTFLKRVAKAHAKAGRVHHAGAHAGRVDLCAIEYSFVSEDGEGHGFRRCRGAHVRRRRAAVIYRSIELLSRSGKSRRTPSHEGFTSNGTR